MNANKYFKRDIGNRDKTDFFLFNSNCVANSLGKTTQWFEVLAINKKCFLLIYKCEKIFFYKEHYTIF